MAQPASTLENNHFLAMLQEMRKYGGAVLTSGLSDKKIVGFLDEKTGLSAAIQMAYDHFQSLQESHDDLLRMDEAEQMRRIQDGFTNFYPTDAVNPYVTAGAKGPWIVTLKGAVVYDCGGYGMLGFGHAPDKVLEAMNKPHVMANIMTPNVSQMEFVTRLRKELGHRRKGGNPFSRFLCLNSGSESVSVAARIADIGAKEMTDPGAKYEGWVIRGLTLKGSFHGRTDKPARHSDSSRKNYRKYLASYRNENYLMTVVPNDIESLEAAFQYADDNKIFIQTFFMEPVMGEGNPGEAITPEFYARARELTARHDTLLLVDSIQAGLRAQGVLSITDYPGFEELPAPDMETYSKALNAGQYPLSVLALSGRAATLYKQGIYGNTMTSNPRALDVAISVLDQLTPEVRENIRKRGRQLLDALKDLESELGPDYLTKVQGTGLLLSAELNTRFKCYGAGSTEEYLRKNGLGVIHGGTNSLRYTPYFLMSRSEVDLVVELTRDAVLNGPTVPPAE